ncbi:hypothetical protein ANO11243_067010 [Dothideomycetidae sp. 11243]|nr:hypothetical protein ANO11243_067010 [fungal sp. No.11243]
MPGHNRQKKCRRTPGKGRGFPCGVQAGHPLTSLDDLYQSTTGALLSRSKTASTSSQNRKLKMMQDEVTRRVLNFWPVLLLHKPVYGSEYAPYSTQALAKVDCIVSSGIGTGKDFSFVGKADNTTRGANGSTPQKGAKTRPYDAAGGAL